MCLSLAGWAAGLLRSEKGMDRIISIFHYNTEIVQSQCVLVENLKVKDEGPKGPLRG